MSGLITGLSIGGAFAGAAAGFGLTAVSEIGAVFMVFPLALMGEKNFKHSEPRPLLNMAAGAVAGAVLLGGSGYLYENAGTLTEKASHLFDAKPAAIDGSQPCGTIPPGAEVTIIRRTDGTMSCSFKAP